MCNAGHFDVEVCKKSWKRWRFKSEQRKNIMGYQMEDGRWITFADGRLVNLAAGDGHPAEIMDMSFALQALVPNMFKE